MQTIEIKLDERTLERAQRLAQARQCSVQDLVKDLLARASDPLVGMFADEPELIDEVVESAMRARENQPLRRAGG